MPAKPGKSEKAVEAAEVSREGDGAEVSARLAELKSRVTRAAKLIAELRDSNYALSGEVAALTRRVEELEAGSGAKDPPKKKAPEKPNEAESGGSSRDRDRLSVLLEERKTIRRKVEKLLERVEKLES